MTTGAAGGSPVICRSRIAGRRATIRGGAVRRGRTAAGRARSTAGTEAGGAAAPEAAATASEEAGAAPAFAVRCTGGMAAAPAPAPAPPAEEAPGREPGAAPAPVPRRWTGALRPGFRPPARPAAADADGRSAAAGPASASPSACGRAARSSSGPPGEVECAEPGRVTPWMRPTGADGRTAWPSSPPRDGFCQEASWDRNRSPSLTPIEDRATVTAGGATRRHPPSQSEPPEAEAPAPGAPVPTPSPPAPAEASAPTPATASATPPPCPSVRRRSQSPSPTRSPAFVDAGVDPRYLPHPLLTFRVGEVENVLTLPMEVVGDVRDLLPQPGKRVRHDSPRRPPERSTSNEPWQSGQVTAACVWPSLLIRR
ncbi:hypothetical protein SCYAM73S_06117 [Streptomyces cyaneofuscatus]